MDIEELTLEDHPVVVLQTPARFAECSGLTYNTVKHWIAEGILPTYRVKRRVLINIPKFKLMLLQARIHSSAPNKKSRR